MGRPPKFERRDMVGAALRLVADRGPQGLTVAALAREIGAPTGSIYHRYESREQLLAELWMDTVEGFQAAFVAGLGRADDIEGGVRAAVFMIAWAREHVMEARLLLLHRRQDFVADAWPAALVERAAALEPQMGAALRAFAERVFGRVDADILTRLRYALLDAPLGGLRPYVQSRRPVPPALDELVAVTARAVLAAIDGPRRILVVDDNVDGADSLALLLELGGHEVAAAHDGREALAVAAAFAPDVVLLDIGLPELDGYEVARRLRADPRTAGARLIALTGWGSDADKRRSRDAGFDAQLTKPVDAATLTAVLAAP